MDTLRDLTGELAAHGDRPVVVQLAGEGIHTHAYADLHDDVARVAQGLLTSGFEPGDHIAIVAENGYRWFAAALATLHAGCVLVPLDTQLGDDEMRRILDDSRAVGAFAGARGAKRLDHLGFAGRARIIELDDGGLAQLAERGEGSRGSGRAAHLPSIGAHDRAVLFYTSGTTGPAKGVPLSHRNLAYQVATIREERLLEPDDRVLLPLPMHHVYPFVIGMLVPLSYGIPVVIPQALTGPELARALREGRVSAILGVPRLYRALVGALMDRVRSAGKPAAWALDGALAISYHLARMGYQRGKLFFGPLHARLGPDVRLAASGGAPLDPQLERRLIGLGWDVAVGYGLTETAPLLTVKRPGVIEPGAVGTPIEGTDVRIASAEDAASDDRSAHDAPADAPDGGEVQARGPGVFHGYHRRPDADEGAFTDDGWFRTGDLGRWTEEGHLELLGRTSTLLVTEGGENVRPDVVEEHYGADDRIREIAVLERGGHVVALLVPEPRGLLPDQSPEDAAREAVEERSRGLPSYQRVTDVAITREPLPRTRLGDLRRHLVEERYDRAAHEEGTEERGPVAPEEMTPADRELLEDPAARAVWEILASRYPDRRLAPETSPRLGLGIDSLAWVDLTLEIERRTGVELSEEAVERIETVRGLMEEVADQADPERVGARAPATMEGRERWDQLEDPDTLVAEDQRRWLKPLGPLEKLGSRAMYGSAYAMMRAYCRLRVVGADRLRADAHAERGASHEASRADAGVPERTPLIFAPNHVSYADPVALAAALPPDLRRNTQWAGSDRVVFGNPILRTAGRLGWGFPVEPGRAALGSLALGAAALQKGRNIVWFPEARRSPTGELQPFRSGIGRLVAATAARAVPVYLQGTDDALPRGAYWPRPKPVTVWFGAPGSADELEAEGDGDTRFDRIADGLRKRVAALIRKAEGGP